MNSVSSAGLDDAFGQHRTATRPFAGHGGARPFRAAGDQTGPGNVIPCDVLPDLLEDRFRRAQANRLAAAVARQLVRENAQDVEIRRGPMQSAALRSSCTSPVVLVTVPSFS